MNWKPDRHHPLVPQICEHICVQIARENWAPHTRLSSVRDTAAAMGVNPNTVQQAFAELERQGVLYSEQGVGWFVGEDHTAALETVARLAQEKTALFFADMSRLGLDPAAVKQYVKEWNV